MWGLWEMIRSGMWTPHKWNYYRYKRSPRELPFPSCYVKTEKRQPCMHQEAALHRTVDPPTLWSWTCQPPELLRNKFLLFLSHWVYVFYSSSPKGLRYWQRISVMNTCHLRSCLGPSILFGRTVLHTWLGGSAALPTTRRAAWSRWTSLPRTWGLEWAAQK